MADEDRKSVNRELGWAEYLGRVEQDRIAKECYAGLVGWSAAGIAPHEHSHPHFIYVLRGRLATAASANGPIAPGSGVFTPAGMVHADAVSRDGLVMTVGFSPDIVRETRAYVGPLDRPCLLGAAHRRLFDELVRECRDWEAVSPLVVESLGMELLAATARGGEADRKPPPWLAAVRDRIEEEGPVGTQALARAAGVHPVHLARTFRRHFGCSPGHYGRRVRLRRAAEGLARTDAPLTALAAGLGFADQSHMTRLFTRAFGVAPAAFRRRHAG